MNHDTRTDRVEPRRRLLKGALAASSVMSMGYSGAALASISCVVKVRTNGGYPAGTAQFYLGVSPPPPTGLINWKWVQVDVNSYKLNSGGTNFNGFVVDGKLYDVLDPGTAIPAGTWTYVGGNPQIGWVLGYFTDSGAPAGSYPTYSSAVEGHTPATQSCLTSLNPGTKTGSGFGG